MKPDALAFLIIQRVSVLGILQDDTTLHSSTLHFAYNEENNMFYFLTDSSSRKCRPLLSGGNMHASVVIGFNEEACETFQAEGTVKILHDSEEQNVGWETYGSKYPERAGAREHSGVALLQFTPTWSRFSGLDTTKKFSS
jgi:general stress protein 26